jgi:aminoglycoside phosphotransferase family enzyme
MEGSPVLFDATEFSPVIASGDTLYDLAFLPMDLVERGLPQAANIVFNRYLVETKRTEDLWLLVLHLAQDQHRQIALRRKIGLGHLEFGVARFAHALAAEADQVAGGSLVDGEMELADRA